MRMLKIIGIVSVLFTTVYGFSETINVNPANSVIVLPTGADGIKRFAATELAKHLTMITGVSIPVIEGSAPADKYAFMVGIVPPGAKKDFSPEEGVVSITPENTWFWGDDLIYSKSKKKHTPVNTCINSSNRTGTLFAVYIFLEKEFGIKWYKPGDDGIVFTPTKNLTLNISKFEWTPKLIMREIRPGYSKKTIRSSKKSPKAFQLTKEQRDEKLLKTEIWLKRMKMGRSIVFKYGHAFTKWWEKYGKDHPEYFALNSKGKREPFKARLPGRVKLCVSNPAVRELIVENFIKSGGKVINTCANDSGWYCECEKCRALDSLKDGEVFGKNLTDRYIWFANQIQRLARKQVPDTQAIMYAYSSYRQPPRKVKVDDGVILGFVPTLLNPDLESYYRSWREAGAKKLFLRPNDMFFDPGLPMGFEKKMFDNFQFCYKYGAFGTDYDSIHNFWPVSGIANYIIARAISDPEKSFEYWKDEYCSSYGAAAPEIKNYYDYWRKNIFEKKLIPDRKIIQEKGRYGNFRRGLMWLIADYYTDADFVKTDAMLKAGLKKKLSPTERKRLELVLLQNQHARLTYEAMRAKNRKPRDFKKMLSAATALLNFREKYREDLDFNWEFLFGNESLLGDVCGIGAVASFKDVNALKKLDSTWYFNIDVAETGLSENWDKSPWEKIKATWDKISIETFWEQAKCHPELHTELEKYNGIGWYATKLSINEKLKNEKLYLHFGAVDESCWVYVNGKLAGKHLNEKPDDWKTPFEIRIDQYLNWDTKNNTIVVRVEDRSGAGGIWQPVWLVNEKK